MADWGYTEGAQLISQTANTAASTGHVTLTGGVGSKGSVTQLVASTPWDAVGIVVALVDTSATATVLVDVMAGSSSNEYVIVPDLLRSGAAAVAKGGARYFFPIFIAAGTRLSGRAAVSATCNVDVSVSLLRGNTVGAFGKVTAYGADVANARGTIVDAGGSAHTKGTVSELASSSAESTRLLTVSVGYGGDTAKAAPTNRLLLDILAGSAGNEYALVGNEPLTTNSSLGTYVPGTPVVNMPVYIPKGTRISARTQSTSTDAGDRLCDVIVYGVS